MPKSVVIKVDVIQVGPTSGHFWRTLQFPDGSYELHLCPDHEGKPSGGWKLVGTGCCWVKNEKTAASIVSVHLWEEANEAAGHTEG